MGEHRYLFADYGRALQEHYPDHVPDTADERYVENVAHASQSFASREGRLQEVGERHFGSVHDAWRLCRPDVQSGAVTSYKGLLLTKTPFDRVLYENLVWELRPGTILELGSLQGGSGLWLADMLDRYGLDESEVHSFDLLPRCVHPSAKHPRLHFHGADLCDLSTLGEELLARLPHPWLVVDDAHVNVLAVARHLNRHMQVGDYYVFEDIGLSPTLEFVQGLQAIGELGFVIDTDYTDAYGYNLTAAPNGWLRKTR